MLSMLGILASEKSYREYFMSYSKAQAWFANFTLYTAINIEDRNSKIGYITSEECHSGANK